MRIDRGRAGIGVRAVAAGIGRVTGTEPPGVFLTLGRHPRVFWSWLLFASTLMPTGKLPRRDSELMILRVGHLAGCDYELVQHRALGRRAGLTDAEIERVAVGPSAPGWSDRDLLLLTVADELYADEDLCDATWAALRAELDEQRALELVLLLAHYRMLATALTTFRVPPDRQRAR